MSNVMNGIADTLGVHSNALMLRQKRNHILASNISNAATPNFKARDINFQEELAKAENLGSLATTHHKHIPIAMSAPGQDVVYRQPINLSMDGNTVELAVEQLEFSENAMRYQTSLTFLNNKISGLMSAIKGE
jgi:flagellar basal-body rod protein FlgB